MVRRAARQAAEAHPDNQRRYFETLDSGYMAPVRSTYVERQVDNLVAFGGLQPGMRVLEIGCGMGRYSIPLAQRGLVVEGLDISPVLLERLRGHDPGIGTHCASVTDHPAELDGRFDAVAGFFILHHLEDLGRNFRAIRRLLRPGGSVVFLEPNPFNPLYYAQITLSPNMRWWAERGLFDMRRRVLLPVMSAAGFTDVARRTFGFLPPFAVNRRFGPELESVLERVPIWRRALPFQMVRATLDLAEG